MLTQKRDFMEEFRWDFRRLAPIDNQVLNHLYSNWNKLYYFARPIYLKVSAQARRSRDAKAEARDLRSGAIIGDSKQNKSGLESILESPNSGLELEDK